jgi:hypothetical protein
MRVLVSTPPPGVADTTMRMGFAGQACAQAVPAPAASKATGKAAASAGSAAGARGARTVADIEGLSLVEGAL